MKYNYCLVVVIIGCIYASYVNVQKFQTSLAQTDVASVINAYLNKTQNKVPVNDPSFADREKNSSASGKEFRDQTKVLDDNSKLNTMYDRVGNKTEARCFDNHPRLTCVVLSAAVNGQRQVLVYGQNGDIKELPENMLDSVTTASGDELANSAGIYAARLRTAQTGNTQTSTAAVLPTPLIMSGDIQTSIQNTPVEQVRDENPEKSEQTIASSENKSTPAGDVPLKEDEKAPAPTRKPEEKK